MTTSCKNPRKNEKTGFDFSAYQRLKNWKIGGEPGGFVVALYITTHIPMVVRLRLQRFGQKNRPFYRVVAANAAAPRNGKFLEMVSFLPSFIPFSLLPSFLLFSPFLTEGAKVVLYSFLYSFLPSLFSLPYRRSKGCPAFLPLFLLSSHAFLPSFIPSFLPSSRAFLPSFLPSFLYSFLPSGVLDGGKEEGVGREEGGEERGKEGGRMDGKNEAREIAICEGKWGGCA